MRRPGDSEVCFENINTEPGIVSGRLVFKAMTYFFVAKAIEACAAGIQATLRHQRTERDFTAADVTSRAGWIDMTECKQIWCNSILESGFPLCGPPSVTQVCIHPGQRYCFSIINCWRSVQRVTGLYISREFQDNSWYIIQENNGIMIHGLHVPQRQLNTSQSVSPQRKTNCK